MRHSFVRIVFNFYGYYHGGMAGSIFDEWGLAPTLTTNGGGGREPMIRRVYETE